MKNRAPAFLFYASDFLMDEHVALMSLEERGAYITLICYCWREGSLPTEMDRLGRLCGLDGSAMAQLWLSLEPCFSLASGRYVQPRLNEEKQAQAEHRKERSESGKRGALSRWKDRTVENKDSSADAQSESPAIAKPIAQPLAKLIANDGFSSSSSSSSSLKTSSTKKGKAPPDPRTHTPAIEACRELLSRYPKKELWDGLIEVLGDHPDIAKLTACRHEWLERGYNAESIKWATEWYVSGIPDQGQKQNAKTIPGNSSGNAQDHAAIVAKFRRNTLAG